MKFIDSNVLVYFADGRNPKKQSIALQFYDSLLLAAAESAGCDEFLTEDLNDGQVYCGIKAVNPFPA